MNNGHGIYSLLRGWIISTGSFAVLIMLGIWITKTWLPFVAFALQLLIYAMVRANRDARVPVCTLMPFIASRVLFWSGVIMLIINFMVAKGYIHYFYTPSSINPRNPYITVLIVAPVAMGISAWALLRRNLPFCVECRQRHGEAVERGFMGILFTQESHYQLQMLLVLASVLTLISWGYYFLFYINVNMNTPDRFFFIWVPVLYTFATFIYMAMRYAGIYSYYWRNNGLRPMVDEPVSRVRFIIISGDTMLLAPASQNELTGIPVNKLDTPVTMILPRREYISIEEAAELFRSATKVEASRIRFMYKVTSASNISNVFHFIALIDDPKAVNTTSLQEGEWFTIQSIQQLMENRCIDSRLSAEVVRLHDVAMAWKTYDREGRRLYKIRNYRPTFRLRDLDSWDVDFNDPQWLNVSVCNQDRRFWRLRRFWRKYINGLH